MFRDALFARGHVEESCGWLYLYIDCLLHAVECYFVGYRIVIYISGDYARVLDIFGAAVHIKLLVA